MTGCKSIILKCTLKRLNIVWQTLLKSQWGIKLCFGVNHSRLFKKNNCNDRSPVTETRVNDNIHKIYILHADIYIYFPSKLNIWKAYLNTYGYHGLFYYWAYPVRKYQWYLFLSIHLEHMLTNLCHCDAVSSELMKHRPKLNMVEKRKTSDLWKRVKIQNFPYLRQSLLKEILPRHSIVYLEFLSKFRQSVL